MKGVIDPDHIPVNKYTLKFLGFADLTPMEVSGMEDELQTTDLPDRTRASGGHRGVSEFTMMLPMHHTVEQAAMELWFRECQDPILPTYKKIGTLIMQRVSGQGDRSYTLVGVFPTKRALPDLDLSNEGEMASVEWTMSVDDIIPI
jgi:hypothetical protein